MRRDSERERVRQTDRQTDRQTEIHIKVRHTTNDSLATYASLIILCAASVPGMYYMKKTATKKHESCFQSNVNSIESCQNAVPTGSMTGLLLPTLINLDP